MSISLGFIVILFLILFPGLIFRKLYFYDEFSKEFNNRRNLISLLAISSAPGIVIAILSFAFYNYVFVNINVAEIIDKYKDLITPGIRLADVKETHFNQILKARVMPFIAFEYIIAVILGMLSGRIIRISQLDTKFKLLRFRNYWFYIFNNQHNNFKKYKDLKRKNQKHLFTKADILIDCYNKTHLYSGYVVDYELNEGDCTKLDKVCLRNAQRYSLKEGERKLVNIPGELFTQVSVLISICILGK